MALTDQRERRQRLEALLNAAEKRMFAEKHGLTDSEIEQGMVTDIFALGHVLKSSRVLLSANAQHGLREELDNWDRTHLIELAENIPVLMLNPEDEEKTRYIIEHSIQENLPKTLASASTSDKFASYNARVINRLGDLGINLETWLAHGETFQIAEGSGLQDSFSIAATQWKRDFRTEYAMGNVSDCCIAINADPATTQYKRVLLDYFLDLSVQVAKLRKISRQETEPIGQIYFVATETKHGPILGITSVEIAKKERDNLEITVPIVETIMGKGGFAESFGYDATFVGPRFNMFARYLDRRRQTLRNLIGMLKERRHQQVEKKARAKRRGEEITPHRDAIADLDREMELLRKIKQVEYTARRVDIRKTGLEMAIASREPYLGTNYLDLFGKTPVHPLDPGDGFFIEARPPNKSRGYLLTEESYAGNVEPVIHTLRAKYSKNYAEKMKDACE